MIIVLMGVSGSGKTTVGKIVAEKLGWIFADGDDFHPPANIEKMRHGTPLTDADREPWLHAVREYIDEVCDHDQNLVLACSALHQDYRDYLTSNSSGCIQFVFLKGDEQLIRTRLEGRKGHFMPPALLQSQFDLLEPPANSAWVDISDPPDVIAERIIGIFNLTRAGQ